MGGHRGDKALAAVTPGAARDIAIATALGFVGAFGYYAAVARPNKQEWAKINRDYKIKEAAERKEFVSWLAAQPYDDEVAPASTS